MIFTVYEHGEKNCGGISWLGRFFWGGRSWGGVVDGFEDSLGSFVYLMGENLVHMNSPFPRSNHQNFPRTSTPSPSQPWTNSPTLFLFQPSLIAIVSTACLPSKYLTHLFHAACSSSPLVLRICAEMAERWWECRPDARWGFGRSEGSVVSCAEEEVEGWKGRVVWVLEVGEGGPLLEEGSVFSCSSVEKGREGLGFDGSFCSAVTEALM